MEDISLKVLKKKKTGEYVKGIQDYITDSLGERNTVPKNWLKGVADTTRNT